MKDGFKNKRNQSLGSIKDTANPETNEAIKLNFNKNYQVADQI